jgi:hypothetical protein
MPAARLSKQRQKSRASEPTKEGWKTADVDPKALFIWETENHRIVVGRALVFAIAAMISGTSLWNTSASWVPLLIKFFR